MGIINLNDKKIYCVENDEQVIYIQIESRDMEKSDEELENIYSQKSREYSLMPKIDLSYKVKRAKEYPSYADYLDAKVKQASSNPVTVEEGFIQEKNYHQKCLDVKLKYPKN